MRGHVFFFPYSKPTREFFNTRFFKTHVIRKHADVLGNIPAKTRRKLFARVNAFLCEEFPVFRRRSRRFLNMERILKRSRLVQNCSNRGVGKVS